MASEAQRGRPRAASRTTVEAAAVGLFMERGYEETTVNDIASAAGIGRSTFFRYFPSKGDILWRPFDEHLVRLEELLRARPDDEPMTTSIQHAVMQGLEESGDSGGIWLRRFVAQETPTLQADESLRWARWAAVVSDFAESRIPGERGAPIAAVLGGAVQTLILRIFRIESARATGSDAVLARVEIELRRALDALRPYAECAE